RRDGAENGHGHLRGMAVDALPLLALLPRPRNGDSRPGWAERSRRSRSARGDDQRSSRTGNRAPARLRLHGETPPRGGGLTRMAAVVIVAFALGWIGRDLWDFCLEMFELYREQR